ncbi:KpsF/GutQ family sugar-phosphate isomerase [Pseudalkalibacillus hwajinpoensis]|uniref:KpsF/GutQ family sugar-phosphate isomerase n=1 Tax=Guptibacillus hwajinpoensis TaxID=208199 RepID=UPI001CFDFCE1|nr:KpsF/GutQ family sugar-phosphate isomerase [Pseudalkalibacillus hwajinpoensis]
MTTSVENKQDYLGSVKEVLEIEANAILSLSERLNGEINQTIEMILKCKNRVVVTGMGKSGLIAQKIVATLASTGTPSLFLHPAEGLHGDLGMVTKDDVVIAISNSGETDEILNILPSLKRIGPKMVALVGKEKSTLAEKSDVILSIGKVEEACPLGLAPTTSTTVTLAIGDAIAIALLKARDFQPEHFALFHPGGSLGRKLLLTIQDVIDSSTNNPVVYGDVEVKDVLFEMTKSGLGAISIIGTDGTLEGILTDGDIRRALIEGNHILETPVSQLYSKDPVTITNTILAAEALKIMEDKRVNVLPVLNDKNEPISMVHIHDLTKMGL